MIMFRTHVSHLSQVMPRSYWATRFEIDISPYVFDYDAILCYHYHSVQF